MPNVKRKPYPYRKKIDRVLVRLPEYPGKDECWMWPGALTDSGYGKVAPGPEGGTWLVHRIVYEYMVGPIPKGLDLDHLCRVRACVNPAHLEPVTRRENLARGEHNHRGKERCKNGHEFTEENTYVNPKHPTWRNCRKCVNEAQKRYQARNHS